MGVLESAERSVYALEGRAGEWVRYGNFYHPLHSADNFPALLAQAKADGTYFFNNECSSSEDPINTTLPAPFIFEDEPAFVA